MSKLNLLDESVLNSLGHRKCSHCGKLMTEGYVIDGGTEYYCSDRCLYKHYTHKEYDDMYGSGETDTYYTTWEEPIKVLDVVVDNDSSVQFTVEELLSSLGLNTFSSLINEGKVSWKDDSGLPHHLKLITEVL